MTNMMLDYFIQSLDKKFVGCHVSGIPIGNIFLSSYKRPIGKVGAETLYSFVGLDKFVILPYSAFKRDSVLLLPTNLENHVAKHEADNTDLEKDAVDENQFNINPVDSIVGVCKPTVQCDNEPKVKVEPESEITTTCTRLLDTNATLGACTEIPSSTGIIRHEVTAEKTIHFQNEPVPQSCGLDSTDIAMCLNKISTNVTEPNAVGETLFNITSVDIKNSDLTLNPVSTCTPLPDTSTCTTADVFKETPSNASLSGHIIATNKFANLQNESVPQSTCSVSGNTDIACCSDKTPTNVTEPDHMKNKHVVGEKQFDINPSNNIVGECRPTTQCDADIKSEIRPIILAQNYNLGSNHVSEFSKLLDKAVTQDVCTETRSVTGIIRPGVTTENHIGLQNESVPQSSVSGNTGGVGYSNETSTNVTELDPVANKHAVGDRHFDINPNDNRVCKPTVQCDSTSTHNNKMDMGCDIIPVTVQMNSKVGSNPDSEIISVADTSVPACTASSSYTETPTVTGVFRNYRIDTLSEMHNASVLQSTVFKKYNVASCTYKTPTNDTESGHVKNTTAHGIFKEGSRIVYTRDCMVQTDKSLFGAIKDNTINADYTKCQRLYVKVVHCLKTNSNMQSCMVQTDSISDFETNYDQENTCVSNTTFPCTSIKDSAVADDEQPETSSIVSSCKNADTQTNMNSNVHVPYDTAEVASNNIKPNRKRSRTKSFEPELEKKPKLKPISDDEEDKEFNNRRKSSRLQTKGFRPDYLALERLDDSDIEWPSSDDEQEGTPEQSDGEAEFLVQDCMESDDDAQLSNNHTSTESNVIVSEFEASSQLELSSNVNKKVEKSSNIGCNQRSSGDDPDFSLSNSDRNSSDNICSGGETALDDDQKRIVRKIMTAERRLKRLKNRIKISLDDHPDKYVVECVQSRERRHRGKPKEEISKDVFICKLCDAFESDVKDKMEIHIEEHVNGDMDCKVCKFKGKTISDLKRHKHEAHINPRLRNICSRCGIVMYSPNALLVHLGMVHNDPQLKCVYCQSLFANRLQRTSHERRAHTDKIKNWCDKCEQQFVSMNAEEFERHTSKCVGKEQLPCEKCGKLFGDIVKMRNHIRFVHEAVRRYHCPRCSFRSCTSAAFRRHSKIHNGDHPYKCEQCTFSCVQTNQLSSHMRTHTGDKPYKCSKCNYAATWNVQLKDHKKLHGLPISVMCEDCGVLFKSSRTLAMHKKKDNCTHK